MQQQTPYSPAYRGFDLSSNDFAANPDPRVPCVLLLDVSGSMHGAPIDQLNAGLQQFKRTLLEDPLAARRVDVAIFTFGGSVNLACDFTTTEAFEPPTLEANGSTPMAEALARAMKHLDARKNAYAKNGIAYYRPWIFLMTDGSPTDSQETWQAACRAARLGEEQKKFALFAIGTEGANFDTLREVSPARPPLKLKGVAFDQLFDWLSNSLSRVSQSQVGTSVALAPINGWGEVAS